MVEGRGRGSDASRMESAAVAAPHWRTTVRPDGGATVRQVIDALERRFPGLKAELDKAEEDMVMPDLAVVMDGETSQRSPGVGAVGQ
jgi:hypothetical protein